MNPMSLKGGLDMYGGFGVFKEKTQPRIAGVIPEGRKVVYLNQNGYDWDRTYANNHFKKGAILTIKEIYVGRGSSEVEFKEFPNKKFNTVMFADLTDAG